MPIAHIHLLEGRDQKQKAELIRRVSHSIAEVLEVPLETIRVILDEVPPQHWGVGGEPIGKRTEARRRRLGGRPLRHGRH